MKVLIISPGKLPVPASCGGAVENLIQQLLDNNEQKCKYDFTIVSVYEKSAFELSKKYKNTRFIFIECDNLFYKVSRVLRYLINRIPGVYIGNAFIHLFTKKYNSILNDFDCVIVENSPEYGLKLKHKNMILHMHNDFLNVNTDMSKKILNRYSKVFSLSNFISNRIREIDKNYNNVFTLYNGIDVNKFERKCDLNIMKKHDLSKNHFIILYTGRIVPEKGVLELVKAFNKINNNNFKLVIVGDLFSNKSYSKKLLLEKNYNDNIVFTGKVSYDDIPKYYSIANVGVVPSIWEEPFALTVIEHLASGHPIVITHSGAMPELVNSRVAVIVEKDKNVVDNIADGIMSVYNNNFDKKATLLGSIILLILSLYYLF